MAGKRVLRPGELARRTVDVTSLQEEVPCLRVVPRERLGILSAGRLRGHSHAGNRGIEMSLQLPGVCDAGICRGVGPMARHGVEGVERGVVFAKLDVRVTDDAIVPGVVRMNTHRTRRQIDRLAETML